MKISLISTVKNEEENITYFIESITKQKRIPDEFVIVDGGSTDSTYHIIKRFAKKYKWIRAFQSPGANISKGRNEAIAKAKYGVIATCDAGSKYDANWLRNLEKGFNGQVGFGTDRPMIRNKFHKNLSKVILHKSVVGSSRNMIFLKKIWKEAKGYPEDLLLGEDTLFDEKIKKLGYKIGRISDAVCLWEMRPDMASFRKQFYNYGYWDGVSFKRHALLPLKHILAGFLYVFLVILKPVADLLLEEESVMQIRFYKRYEYARGFTKGFFKNNLKGYHL